MATHYFFVEVIEEDIFHESCKTIDGAKIRMNWLYLAIAIFSEVIATSALKASLGFSKLLPSMIVLCGYSASFYLLSLSLRSIPLGIAYAIWSGVGLALVTLVGWYVYDQKLDVVALIGITLIITGVIILSVFSKATAH